MPEHAGQHNPSPTLGILWVLVAATAGILAALFAGLNLMGTQSDLPLVTLLWCRDFPELIVAEAPSVPPGVAGASKYGDQERRWLEEAAAGYDDACSSAFARHLGPLPSAGTPLPPEPPGWHVLTRRYLAPDESSSDGWLVVYGTDVWRCQELSVVDGQMNAEWDCHLDPRAPLPSPGTY
jgi:hypothetical protein